MLGAVFSSIGVVAASALFLLNLSDAGHPLSPFYFLYANLFQSGLGYYFFLVLAYAISLTGLSSQEITKRVFLAQGALLLALIGVYALAFPVLFGLGEAGAPAYIFLAIYGFCGLVGAIVHRRVLRSGVPAAAELFGHLAAFAGLIIPFATEPVGVWTREHLLGRELALFGLVPFLVIVVARARPLTFLWGICIVLAAVAPVYFGRAALDLVQGRTTPFLWPVRVAADFMPLRERNRLIRELSGSVSDKSVRLGAHWYRFKNIASSFAWPNQDGVPDRLVVLELGIPKEQLGLPARGKWIQLKLKAGPQLLPSRSRIAVRYDDLTIEVDTSGVDGWPDDETIREKLLAYVLAARVSDQTSR